MTLGTEWLIDASGCDAAALANLDRLRAVFDRVIRDLNLHVLGEIAWHQFDHPGGVSGLALLSESHLSCHTYPEFQAATFNLYCCRRGATWTWETTLKEMLGATEVNVRVFERMVHHDATDKARQLAGVAK
jgi:S-adenosylmethionine decarboxylase